jgi:hypothetical protein
MADFPTLVQALLFLLAIGLMIGTVFFFRRPATRKILSQENRAILLLLSLAVIFFTSIMIGLEISDWKSKYRATKNEMLLMQELDLNEYKFINQTFKPLGEEYSKLKSSLNGLDKMNIKISELMILHKNHQPLLKAMLDSFTAEKKTQSELYKRINIEIRNAMILSSTTQNSVSMQDQFYKRAKILHAKILKAQARSNKKLGQMAGLLADSLKESRKLLTQVKTKKRGKKRTRPELYYFPDQTAQTLLGYYEGYDSESLESIKEIIHSINIARQKKDTMMVLSQKETDLQIPMKKTMLLWSDAEMQGQKYWGNLLYSIEAIYLADQFNMPKHKPAFRYLWRDLKKTIPRYLEKITKLQREAGNSYFTPVFAGKK